MTEQKEELKAKLKEKLTDAFDSWQEENWSELEQLWLTTISPEDVPLDDDGPDFMQDNAEEFSKWCMQYILNNEE